MSGLSQQIKNAYNRASGFLGALHALESLPSSEFEITDIKAKHIDDVSGVCIIATTNIATDSSKKDKFVNIYISDKKGDIAIIDTAKDEHSTLVCGSKDTEGDLEKVVEIVKLKAEEYKLIPRL